ncbi:MAG: ABC transporter permease [Oscillospiraceae bacterium]
MNTININNSLKKIAYVLLPLSSLIMLVLVWIIGAKSAMIPAPVEVYERFIQLLEHPVSKISVLGHIWASLLRVIKALGLSIIIGIPFGLLIGGNHTFCSLFKPLFELFRPLPPIAWIPLISLWFGVGESAKIAIVFIGTFMPIVVNSYTGVEAIPRITTDAAISFGANRWQLLFDIMLPASIPAIFAGIRSALSTGWMVVLAAEMISSKAGLGFLIIRGSDSNDIALTMVSMVLIGIIGAILAYGFDYIERWMCPWNKK